MNRNPFYGVATLAAVLFLAGCTQRDTPSTPEARTAPEKGKAASALSLTSTAFTEGASIPSRYTCDGADVSPPLKWSGLPQGTKSLALICDDPDAPGGVWVHWVLYDLPATATKLEEGIPAKETLPNGASQGTNDFKRTGYGGPCPPPGNAHRYLFHLYALDTTLTLQTGGTKEKLLEKMEGHILAEGQLMGRYQRK